MPDEPGRREILGIHTRGMPLAPDVNLDDLARRTYGFVGADLAALTREAALEAVRRIMPKLNLAEETIPTEVLDALSVELDDFDNALKRVQPSAMREVMVEAPTIGWDDIGGLDAAARPAARRRRAALEASRGVPPARHPPGQGLPALWPAGHRQDPAGQGRGARERGQFHRHQIVRPAVSKWYGESEQQIARLFNRARQVAPTIIFIDELDSLVPARGGGLGEPQVTERVVNTILAEMDGLEELQNVVVIGATNRPTLIDPALLRPGRFDELIYVGTPDTAGRAANPRHPHPQHAAGQGRRPRIARAADRPLHRRRPRGSGAPRRPDRASPRARIGGSDDGGFRGRAGRDPRLGHARDARGI